MTAEATTTRQWYVIHTYSGFENKVKASIEQRAKVFGLEEQIPRVIVPTEEVVEIKRGQKKITPQKFFPGYVLVEMEMNDETWHLVKSTPKVTGFVGPGPRPAPLPQEEVDEILYRMEVGAEKPKPKSVFQKGDKVRVIEGPFINFMGAIEDLNPERGKLKVMVAIFGRLTPVELEYYQVERI
jgi:transcriptional antiterminator NusG